MTATVTTENIETSPSSPAPSGIVVGIDGSDGSACALRWAVHEAHLRGVGIRVIMAWQRPIVYGDATVWTADMSPARAAQEVLAEAKGTADPTAEVTVTYEAHEGHASAVLGAAAADAELLVIGSRGHGGFVGALLGSVSQHLVQHAACPVVIVPERSDEPAGHHS